MYDLKTKVIINTYNELPKAIFNIYNFSGYQKLYDISTCIDNERTD